MITITKTKKGHYVVLNVSDKNGKIIKSSEPLNCKKSAIKNIIAEMNLYQVAGVHVKDELGNQLWIDCFGRKEPIKPKK